MFNASQTVFGQYVDLQRTIHANYSLMNGNILSVSVVIVKPYPAVFARKIPYARQNASQNRLVLMYPTSRSISSTSMFAVQMYLDGKHRVASPAILTLIPNYNRNLRDSSYQQYFSHYLPRLRLYVKHTIRDEIRKCIDIQPIWQ